MSEPFLSEIRIMSFGFPPKGWALCNGQLLPINSNQALFSILGTTYGGNGNTNFALPNLQGRSPMHRDQSHPLGTAAGESSHTLSVSEMPPHTHPPSGRSTANTASPANSTWATAPAPAFAGTPDVVMHPAAIGSTGSGQGHDNMPPYQVVNYIVALVGVFPSRN
jgi:microcystin-dependent protein